MERGGIFFWSFRLAHRVRGSSTSFPKESSLWGGPWSESGIFFRRTRIISERKTMSPTKEFPVACESYVLGEFYAHRHTFLEKMKDRSPIRG